MIARIASQALRRLARSPSLFPTACALSAPCDRLLVPAPLLLPLGAFAPAAARALSGAAAWRGDAAAAESASSSSSSSSSASASAQQQRQRWDITPERWVDIKYSEDDLKRFPSDREAFRSERRLQIDAQTTPPTEDSIDPIMALRGFVSSFRLGDCYVTVFEELVWERFGKQQALMESFGIEPIQDKSVQQPMHSKLIPGEGTYLRVRAQSYWLALHVWLLHNKQYSVQATEGIFGSVLCALLTRRLFEFQWNRIRMLLHAADVPIMSITNELQDLQEFIFGFCVAIDDAFREELAVGPPPKGDGVAGAGNSGLGDVARVLQRPDAELAEGQFGLAPRLKYVLWANVYSGQVKQDDPRLHELLVYFLRQKMMLDALGRDAFFSAKFSWVDHHSSA